MCLAQVVFWNIRFIGVHSLAQCFEWRSTKLLVHARSTPAFHSILLLTRSSPLLLLPCSLPLPLLFIFPVLHLSLPIDLALLHSCTFVSLCHRTVSELSRRTEKLAEWPRMSYLLWNRLPFLPCSIKINSFNLLSETIKGLPEMQSVGAVLDSSDRFEMKFSLELRQAQLNNEVDYAAQRSS